MRRTLFVCCIAVVAGTIVRSSPVDNAILAAMKLRDADSYHWIATVDDNSRFYTIEGKTRKDGYTLVNMPMINSIQRKLGGSGSDIQTAVFKGDADFVVATLEGWKTRAELAATPLVAPEQFKLSGRPRGPAGMGAGLPIRPGNPGFRYSNLQLNLSHPHDEIGIIVGCYAEIQTDAAGVTGTLSEEGAKLLLVHPGQNEITPLHARGTFKLWFKEGALVKYEVQLTGTIAVGTGSNRWEVSLHQTVTTDLNGVGTTTFDLPEEAKRKLG
jgi:hypothetical protein